MGGRRHSILQFPNLKTALQKATPESLFPKMIGINKTFRKQRTVTIMILKIYRQRTQSHSKNFDARFSHEIPERIKNRLILTI